MGGLECESLGEPEGDLGLGGLFDLKRRSGGLWLAAI
jgi:hypothetical protein